MRILIADDELRLRKIVAVYLRKSGHEVYEASSGEQALEMLKSTAVDVIVLDVNMGGITGIETCRIIKSNPDYANIPVALLTANTGTDDMQAGREAGAVAYITKPFSPKDLLEKIEGLV